MILADTSVWIDHLRQSDSIFFVQLEKVEILCHPMVVAEIALGTLRKRETVLLQLRYLPQAIVARDHEVMEMVERHRLHGKGIGYVDAHLLTSVMLTPGTTLWTRDKKLRTVAEALGLDADQR
jgi:predicted nucleic acid-binding protein